MTDREPLTAPQVRAMVDAAGISRHDLEIETDPEVWRDERTGEHIQGVLIGLGPERRAVVHLLAANGLVVHPHDENYMWVTNRPTPIRSQVSAPD
ncbi:hypothetical protein AB0F43_31830 [Kribbella sp. NPDC023972]|uniref:hypothetical protein n=1 Tax=Kribbella sp. NPDC023972 TaxID=3154795 RepID=UPI0033D2C939